MVDTSITLLGRLHEEGDSASWREFEALYRPLLLRWVRSKGLADADAEDVVQEIFASLVAALPQFQRDTNRGRFRSWLWRVMHNAVIDWYRRADKVPQPIDQQQLAALAEVAEQSPSAQWLAEERRRVVQFAMQGVREESEERTWPVSSSTFCKAAEPGRLPSGWA